MNLISIYLFPTRSHTELKDKHPILNRYYWYHSNRNGFQCMVMWWLYWLGINADKIAV